MRNDRPPHAARRSRPQPPTDVALPRTCESEPSAAKPRLADAPHGAVAPQTQPKTATTRESAPRTPHGEAGSPTPTIKRPRRKPFVL